MLPSIHESIAKRVFLIDSTLKNNTFSYLYSLQMNSKYVTAYCKCECIIIHEMDLVKWDKKVKYVGNCSNVSFAKEIEKEVFELICEKCNKIIGKYKKGHVILNKEELTIEIKNKGKEDRHCSCCHDYVYDNNAWENEEMSRRLEENDINGRIKFELEANEYRRSRAQFTKYISEESFHDDLDLEIDVINMIEDNTY